MRMLEKYPACSKNVNVLTSVWGCPLNQGSLNAGAWAHLEPSLAHRWLGPSPRTLIQQVWSEASDHASSQIPGQVPTF